MVTQPRKLKELYLAYLRGDATFEEVIELSEAQIAERERKRQPDQGGQGTTPAP